MCLFVSHFIFSSADRCIWIKTKNIDYKRAKMKLRSYFMNNTDYLVLGQKSGSL